VDNVRMLVEQYLRAAWRRRWLGIVCAWLICGVGWVGVYMIPNQFESSARLFVDADAILTPLLRGLAADTSPMTQLEVLQRTLLSRPNLEKLISKTDLDLTVNTPTDRERLISHLGSTIRVVSQTNNLFTITYRDTNPKLAHDVVQTLLTIFIESATGSNRSDMDNARRFLESQLASYQQQLQAAEKRRADFRARYIDILPNPNTPGVPALEAARGSVAALQDQLQDKTVARDALQKELDNTTAMLVTENAPEMVAAAEAARPKTPLQEAEEKLKLLLLTDTEDHPDVIAQRKLIDFLKKQQAAAIAAAGGTVPKAAPGGPATLKRSVPNPVYDELKVKLIDDDSQIDALKRQLEQAQRYGEKLAKIQREQPGLIAEYENTDRDYGALRSAYEQLLARLQSANIAQAADTQADKVKLQIVDPPQVPRLPVAPNRMLLVSGVLLVGFGAGLGITVLMGQLDSSFATAEDLRALGLPVLGGISVLGLAPLRQRLTTVARFGIAVVLLVGIYGGLLVHILRAGALI
jgi:polysaccharide chain length determinant protein (PEP-CTERM system associated)